MTDDQSDDRFTAEEQAVFDSDGFLSHNIVYTPALAANLSRPSTDHAHLFDFPIEEAVRLCDSEDGGASWMSRSALSSFEDTNGWAPRLHPVADGDMTSTATRDETDHALQASVPQTTAPQITASQTNVPQRTIPAHLDMTFAINHGNLTDWMQFDPETAMAQSTVPGSSPPAGFSWVNGRLMPSNAAVQLGLIPMPSQDAAPTPSGNSQYGIQSAQGPQTRRTLPNQGPTVPPAYGGNQASVRSARPPRDLVNQSEVAGGFGRPEPAGTTWRNGMLVPTSFNTLGVNTATSSSTTIPPQHHQTGNQYRMFHPSSYHNGMQNSHLQRTPTHPIPQYHPGHPTPVRANTDALQPSVHLQRDNVDPVESQEAIGEQDTGSPHPARRRRPAPSGTRRSRGNQPASLATKADDEGGAKEGEAADEENLTSSAKKRKKPRKKSSSTRKRPVTPKKSRWEQHNENRMAQIKAGTAQSDTPFARQDYANLIAAGGHREVTNIANFPLDHIFQHGQSPTAHLRRRRYDYSDSASSADQNQENAVNEDVDEDASGDEEEGGDRDDEFGGDEDAPGEDE